MFKTSMGVGVNLKTLLHSAQKKSTLRFGIYAPILSSSQHTLQIRAVCNTVCCAVICLSQPKYKAFLLKYY